MGNIHIKAKQYEVLKDTRETWKKSVGWFVYNKHPEWIKHHWRDFFQSISTKSREMTKIYKRKRMDDDVKLIELSNLRLQIVNEINRMKEVE